MKDVVKSGGEWISTLFLEDLLTAQPAVMEAAVIAARDEKWGERPVAVVMLKTGASTSEDKLRSHLEGFVEKGKIEVLGSREIPDSERISSEDECRQN
jgi:fatty-acyl-CoA synthase